MPAFEIRGREELIDLVHRIFQKAWPSSKPNEAFMASLPQIESVAKGVDDLVDWVMLPPPQQRQPPPSTAPTMVKPAAITQKLIYFSNKLSISASIEASTHFISSFLNFI